MTADHAKRYPWSQLKNAVASCGEEARKAAAVVDFIVPDPGPGMYGWRSVTINFLTVEEAMEVAKRPMGIARAVHVRQFDWSQWPNGKWGWTIYTRKNAGRAKRKQGA